MSRRGSSPRGGTARSRVTGGLGLALGLTFGLGCGTTYQPRPSPRIGLIVHSGGMFYLQNGHETPIGPLGGDIGKLVAADAAAAAHARRSRTQFAVGVPAYLLGVAAVALSAGLLEGPTKWVGVGTGVALGGTGMGLMGAGFTNALDAINLHNDGVR